MPRDYDDTRLRYCPKCGHRWELRPPRPYYRPLWVDRVLVAGLVLAAVIVVGVILGWL
jgi:hypothetical protein